MTAKIKARAAVILLVIIAPLLVLANTYFVTRAISAYLTTEPTVASNSYSPKGLVGIEGGADLASFTSSDLTELTNRVRANEGKGPLTENALLDQSASAKCADMINQNYWAHNSPAGKEPWVFFDAAGYSYTTAGENLAYGFSSDQSVLDGWMNSPTHKANLMGHYTEVGFGICEGKNYQSSGRQIVIVQHLGTPKAKTVTKAAPAKPVPTYSPPVCTKTPIPYKTNYIDASYMYTDETNEYGGTDGYTERCTADSNGYKPSDYTSQPYDKTVYRGTKPRPETSP